MKLHLSNRNQKVFTALLFCAGLITYPLTVQTLKAAPTVQHVQQQKQNVSGVVKDASGLEVALQITLKEDTQTLEKISASYS